jgi:3-oxoacyl-ACP reductase-like protein
MIASVWLLVATLGLTLADTPAAVRVHVFTATSASGEHTDEEKGRIAAVADIRDALRKKKGLTLVDDAAQAQVRVEVTSREALEPPSGGFGGKQITSLGDFIIRVTVSAGENQAELKGTGQGSWGRAAKDAAERILKWIARHEPAKSGGAVTGGAVTGRRPR